VALAFVGVYGLLVVNPALIALSIVGVLFLLNRVNWVRRRLAELPSLVTFNSDVVEASFTAGELFSLEVAVDSRADHYFTLSVPVGAVYPSEVTRGRNSVTYSFKPELSGVYGFNAAEAVLTEDYGLVSGVTHVGFRARFNVYPRVVAAALQALSFLEGRGIQGGGEQPSPVIGQGFEYAESREYVAGDSQRRIDWKASARLGRLIVKEYYEESSGAVHIIYEADVPDPVSRDELAACFLRSVVSFAEQGWVIGLTVLRGEEIVMHVVELHPHAAVSVALRHVLQEDLSLVRQVYEVLDPVRRSMLRKVMEKTPRDDGPELSVIRDELFQSMYGCVLYLSALIDDPANLLEVCHLASAFGTRLAVLEPCKPWMHLDLEEAYRVWRQTDKVNRSLARSGVAVAVELEEAFELLAEQRYLPWV